MPEMGHPGGKGGAVVKHVFPAAFPLGYGFFENIAAFPKRQDFLFQFWKIYLWIDRLIHLCSSLYSMT
jgi:hypothetical protein